MEWETDVKYHLKNQEFLPTLTVSFLREDAYKTKSTILNQLGMRTYPLSLILLFLLCITSPFTLIALDDESTEITDVLESLHAAWDADEYRAYRMYIDTPPPLVIYEFKAVDSGDDIEVRWTTESEPPDIDFELYATYDDEKSKRIYKIKGDNKEKEKKLYKFLDKEAKKTEKSLKRVVYRLHKKDSTGSSKTIGQTSLIVSQSLAGGDNLDDLLPQNTPKSPNVAVMELFGSTPVSLYTGLPVIEIPIWTIEVGDLKIPIKLKYHPGGHKILDNASWTGLGWSLTGLYALTRDVRGVGDEKSGGILGQSMPSYSSPITCLTQTDKTALNGYINFTNDLERDVFTYRTPNKSNSFVIEPSNVLFLEADKSQISYSPAPNLFQSFNVTDEYGNRYTYDVIENTFSNHVSDITAWHLSDIETNEPGQKIRYTYHDADELEFNSEITYTEVWYTDVCDDAPVSGGEDNDISPVLSLNPVRVDNRNPHEIYFPSGKIVFVQEGTDRDDGLGRALDEIEIYGYNFTTTSYTLIRTYDLQFIYKTRTGTPTEKVLFLDQVDMKDNQGNVIGSYALEYNDTHKLPVRSSLAKDHWGYYNGATNNSTLIPSYTLNAMLTCLVSPSNNSIGGADRDPSAAHMKAWMLTKMTYPTGGFTSYDYEPHESNQGTVGGLRIKSTIDNDGNTTSPKTVTKRYVYGMNSSGEGTDRDHAEKIIRTDQKIKQINNPGPPFNYSYYVRTFSAGVNTVLNPFESVPVTYPEVRVYEDINASGSNGYTLYTYKDNATDDLITHPATSRRVLQSEHWKRGQLLSKVVYDASGNSKVAENHFYTEVVPGAATGTLGYVIGRTEIRTNSSLPNTCTDDDKYDPIRAYRWFAGLTRRDSSVYTQYDDTNDSRSVTRIQGMDYDPVYYQLKETRTYNTDGDIRIQQRRYATDFSNLSSSHSGNAKAIWRLLDNNQLHTPIEVLQLRKKASETYPRVLNGTLWLHKDLLQGTHTYLVPDEVYTLNIPEDTETYENTFSKANVTAGGQVTKDNAYEPRIDFGNYTTAGNLTTYNLIAGPTQAYTYTSSAVNGIYHHRVNSERKNHGGSTTYITAFDQDVPLLGPDEITAPNGLKTSFLYDDFGRLETVKDHSGNISKAFEYNFGSGSSYIKEFYPRIASQTLGTGLNDRHRIDRYFDGLGRHRYTLSYRGAPSAANNYVTEYTTYDNFGRVAKTYIPFWHFDVGAVIDDVPEPSTVHGDSRPFTQVTSYDGSPLNRPKVTYGPGATWFSNSANITNRYKVNSSTVRKYALTATGANVNGTYAANQLIQNEVVSEQGNLTIEYRDNQGKLIQTSEQDDGGYRTTAYIYDDWDRIKYIIQPESFKTSSNFTESSTYFTDGVKAYEYDGRGRIVRSHEPGGGWTSTVYDQLNQVVMTQNDFQDANDHWNYRRYDALQRQIEEGQILVNDSRSNLQDDFDGISEAYEEWDTGSDEYSWQSFPSALENPSDPRIRNIFDYYPSGFVANSAFDASHAYLARYTNGIGWLTWQLRWDSETPSTSYHTVHYYDNKSRLIQTIEGHHLGGSTLSDNPIKTSFNYNFPGELLAQKTTYKIDGLSDITHIDEVNRDNVGRITNHLAGTNASASAICNISYDGVGRINQKRYYAGQTFTAGDGADYIVRPPSPDETNTEDIARKGIILNPGATIDIGQINTYEAEIDDDLGTPSNITGLQTIDYSYNVRDWLLGYNLGSSSGNLELNAGQGDLFSLKLEYETVGRFDGTIGKQSWRIAADTYDPQTTRTYEYTYDPSSRITGATYAGGSENNSVSDITYDKNGNIKTLKRKMTGSDFMDQLTYTYQGNHLMKVEDVETDDHEVDFVNRNTGSNDYEYYPDGCLKKDLNEEITNIEYDLFLGKPKEIELTAGRSITYQYDGAGNLLKRTLSSGETWDYIGSMMLKNGTPYQITMMEGRTVLEEDTWRYSFGYRDQVGNLRMGFMNRDGSLQKTQQADYTPFGIAVNQKIFSPKKQTYTYQGHEEQPDFGLRLTNMQARCYNQTIGRFLAPDPLAELDHNLPLSPYSYVNNNPITNIDPDGLDWYRNKETGEVHWQEGSEDVEGHKNIGSEYILEGTNDFIVHDQNKVVSTISKSSLTVNQSSVMTGAMVTSGALLANDVTVVGTVDDIAIPVILAGATAYELTQRTFVTYTLSNPVLGQVYSGRASGYGDPYSIMLARYMRHHKRAEGFTFPSLDRAIQGYQGKPAIRGREQQLIDFHGGAQSGGGIAGNRIRGVSKLNPLGRFYHSLSNLYFGPLSPYTGY